MSQSLDDDSAQSVTRCRHHVINDVLLLLLLLLLMLTCTADNRSLVTTQPGNRSLFSGCTEL